MNIKIIVSKKNLINLGLNKYTKIKVCLIGDKIMIPCNKCGLCCIIELCSKGRRKDKKKKEIVNI